MREIFMKTTDGKISFVVFTSEKSPPKKRSGKDQPEPVTNCDQFTWEAAKKSGTTETA